MKSLRVHGLGIPFAVALALHATSSTWAQTPKEQPPAAELKPLSGAAGARPLRDVVPRFAITPADLGEQGDIVYGLALSPDGTRLAVGGAASKGGLGRGCRGGVSLWELASRKKTAAIAGLRDLDIVALAFSRQGTLLAVGDYSGGIVLWDVLGGRVTGTLDFKPPEDPNSGSPALGGFRLSPDGQTLAVLPPKERKLRRWDVTTQKEREPWVLPRDFRLSDVAFVPDGTVLTLGHVVDSPWGDLTGNEPARLVLWDATARRVVWTREAVSSVGTAALSVDGRCAVLFESSRPDVAQAATSVLVLDRATGRTTATCSLPKLLAAELSPSGRYLAYANRPVLGEDRPARGWTFGILDGTTLGPLATFLSGDDIEVENLIWSADDRRIAGLFADLAVRVWDVSEILRDGRPRP